MLNPEQDAEMLVLIQRIVTHFGFSNVLILGNHQAEFEIRTIGRSPQAALEIRSISDELDALLHRRIARFFKSEAESN